MKKRRGLFTKEEARLAPKKFGIYFILANRSFSRLRGRTNILYIGQAKTRTLFKRLTGRRNALPRFELLKKNGFKLTFKYRVATSGLKAREMETKELKAYQRKHLELPPLNHSH